MSSPPPTTAAQLDPTVAKVLDTAHDSDDEDELLAELEREDAALDGFRERRLQQLHEEFQRAAVQRSDGTGGYTECTDEKMVMDITTSTKYSLVHFRHGDFRRCKLLDSHLAMLAPKHPECRIVHVDVEKAPFLVERLRVRVLPCLLGFLGGENKGRLEGFERLGNTDSFRTVRLEEVLVGWGVLDRVRFGEDGGVLGEGSLVGKKQEDDDDDDDDWD